MRIRLRRKSAAWDEAGNPTAVAKAFQQGGDRPLRSMARSITESKIFSKADVFFSSPMCGSREKYS
jgi:hypothetical protein